MKLRIQGNTFRFRIDSDDLDRLLAEGGLEVRTHVPGDGGVQTLACSVIVAAGNAESSVELRPFGVCLQLSRGDLATLQDPSRDGVTFQRHWDDGEGLAGVTRYLVEKERFGGPVLDGFGRLPR